MADPTFFVVEAPVTVAEAAALTGARPAAGADLDRRISGVAPLHLAGPADATFYTGERHAAALGKTRAAACFCEPRQAEHVPKGTAALTTDEPQRAFSALAAKLYPSAIRPRPLSGSGGIAPGAHVDGSARLESDVTVEIGAVVGRDAEIGAGSLIGPHAVIGPGVRIGRDVVIGANVTLQNALIGNRVVIHPGARIGQDGFGFIPGKQGHTKIVQIGRVIIQDDVEIGANSTIDRGSNRDTVVGEGTKIDNLVQVAHNVMIGRHCLIAGQVGISGSVTIGDFVMIGGQAGLRDNVTVGAGAQVAAMAGIHTDIPAGERWIGAPAQPMSAWLRELKALKRLVRGGGAGQENEKRE
ncbi:MAG TPA: UDP-3-O-(3-hydroxymyristoyl)glucosamine N-acyltransferase [Bauldia sp.]|nr:UDP-3-O-(3-hydroxymyristoyl)glucosamine N-acyltransferase [Bauldia sp.]